MLEKDINDLLQDYKHRKNILEEITLSDIEKWNNIELDWENILNKPTTLEGYGITEELNSRYLNVENNVVKNASLLQWNNSIAELRSFLNSSNNAGVAFGTDYSMLYSTINGSASYIKSNCYGVELKSQDKGVNLYNGTVLYTGFRNGDNEDNLFPIVQEYSNNLLFGSTKIPNKMNNTLKLPRLDIFNSSDVREGMLYNSTYKVNDVVHDGIHLRHEDGKYLVLGHLDSTAGENGTVYSYMICDVDGVLRDPSDGDEWGPIRFEQQCFFRYGLRISNNEPLIINNYNLATKIASIESAIEEGTGMVKWTNVLNKPSTFTPSSHTHAIANITSLQSSLDGKASSSHNHNINDITDLVSVLNNKIGANGGTLSGNLVLNNNVSLQSKKNDGTIVNLLNMSSNNQVTVGNGLYKVGLVGKTADDIFVWDKTENVSYKVFNEKNLNYDETIAIVNCNTVNASSSEVYISSINQKILDRYSILSTENNKFTITIKETGFYKIDTSVLFGSLNTSLKMYINNDVHTLGYGNRNADIQRLSSGEISLIQGDKITFSFVGGSGVCAIWPVSVIRVH